MNVEEALALSPRGSVIERELIVEVSPDASVRTAAIRGPDGVMLIPVDIRLPDGGFVQGIFKMDEVTYERAIRAAERLGGVPVLRNLLRAASETADFRPILAR